MPDDAMPPFDAAGAYALRLLDKHDGASLGTLAEHAHGITRAELSAGLENLRRHGLAREESGGWKLTSAAERWRR